MSVLRAANDVPIPGYRLLERLGKGGFGEVWKCEAPGGLFKAVKFVNGNEGSDQSGSNAEQELRALHRIKSIPHPYLLSIERIEVGPTGDLMIVTELAECSLHDVLERYRKAGQAGVPRSEAVRYLAEAAEVLDLMNLEHGLQHLDVKPRNLFIVQRHVKVGDFGLVASLAELGGTGGKSLLGGITPLYAAPEVFQSRVTPFSDQYSLAVTYCELVTGDVPIRGRSICEQAVLAGSGGGDFSRLPAKDQAIIARAMHKDADKRYPSCQALIDALMEVTPPASHSSGQYFRARTTSFELSVGDTGGSPPRSNPAFTVPTPSRSGMSQSQRLLSGTVGGPRSTASAIAPAPSEILPGYKLQECLQRGAVGELWKATGPRGNMRLIRFMAPTSPDTWLGGEDPVERLLAFDHPSLAEVQALPAGPDRFALVSEAGDSSLASRLRECRDEQRSGIPREELLHRLGEAATILDELRRREQLQHLALTPRHLAISRGDLVLIEFGMAELFWMPNSVPVGEMNARYAAVELFHGLVSDNCDQYSLALIYQEMLVGVHPFRNLNARQMATARQRQPDLGLLPATDRAIVLQALSPEPEKRFHSCTEFVQALVESTPHVDTSTVSLGRVNTRSVPAIQVEAPAPWKAAVDELVGRAASGHEMRTSGLVSYRLTPGRQLEHRCKAMLAQGMARLKMDGFRERWQAEVLTKAENRLVFDIRTAARGWFGKAPGIVVEVRFSGGKDEDMTPVRVTMTPVDCKPGKADELLAEMAPMLLNSMQTFLHSQSDRAMQERFPCTQAARVQSGLPRLDLEARTRDVSREGMTLLTDMALPIGPVTVTMQRAGTVEIVQVPARVRDSLPLDDVRFESEVVFI